MFNNFNINRVLTNERKIVCFNTSKIDLDLDHMNLNINNDYSFSSGNLLQNLIIIKKLVHKILSRHH